MFEVIRFVLK